MTKAELLNSDAFREAPDDAEVMTQFDPVSRWDVASVEFDKERNTIVIT